MKNPPIGGFVHYRGHLGQWDDALFIHQVMPPGEGTPAGGLATEVAPTSASTGLQTACGISPRASRALMASITFGRSAMVSIR